jgi:glutamate synthase domain-containing protein 3
METLNARSLHYQVLNESIRNLLDNGCRELVLKNVNGQRYIGAGVRQQARLEIHGVPGNNLAALMDGLEIEVFGNAQDGVGNTMNDGTVIIHGNTADITGYSMRGGRIFIRGNVGYRVGIHMKAFQDKNPLIVIGGQAGDFFGEYMAGGNLVLLGLDLPPGEAIAGNFVATGMHGGAIFIRGQVDPERLGKEVKAVAPTAADQQRLQEIAGEFAGYFNLEAEKILARPFTKLIPYNKRPYGTMYAY